MGSYLPQLDLPSDALASPPEHPQSRAHRRLACEVLLLAVRECREGQDWARDWLAGAHPTDVRPGSVAWWLNVGGFDPHHLDKLRDLANRRPRGAKQRKPRTAVRRSAASR